MASFCFVSCHFFMGFLYCNYSWVFDHSGLYECSEALASLPLTPSWNVNSQFFSTKELLFFFRSQILTLAKFLCFRCISSHAHLVISKHIVYNSMHIY